jgi:hypothetical protein
VAQAWAAVALARHPHGVELADQIAKDDYTVTGQLIATDAEKQAPLWRKEKRPPLRAAFKRDKG